MSIFGRGTGNPTPQPSNPIPPSRPQSSPEPERRAARPASGPTHVAGGTRLSGKIHGNADVIVDGELEGLIQVEADVTVGPEGRVKGDIEARSVRIAGSVSGNLKGAERVEILGSGKLQGDVSAPRVILAEGAFFRGNVEMTGGQKDPNKAAVTPSDKAPSKNNEGAPKGA
jgi:cytoskeletal protein CcmA (bactofilin family)